MTLIDCHTFRNCTGLTSVVIPDSVTTLESDGNWGYGAFEGTNNGSTGNNGGTGTTGTTTGNNGGTVNNGTTVKVDSDKKDTTTATGKIPHAGVQIGLISTILVLIVVAILAYSRYRKVRDI